MRLLRDALDRVGRHFHQGGRLEKLYPLYEALDTFAYTPGLVTRTSSHVRDGLDYKRMMSIVVLALVPCIAMAIYNTGYQAFLAVQAGATPLDDWRNAVFMALGGRYDPDSPLFCCALGVLYYLPVLMVTFATGLGIEVTVAILRGHEVNEGFFVTGMLIPLTLPPAIPLWQVALGTAFGVIFAKEIFGGTGMNFLNPALVTRAFLFFAYPVEISGEAPWIAADFADVDGYTGATLLAQAAAMPGALAGASWWDAFVGRIPGSMGETSALACLLGAGLLLLTQVGSWRIMAGVTLGTFAMAAVLNSAGSETNPMFAVPFRWHVVLGGWALGTVYMATDPVSSAFTDGGRWLYGVGIGVLCILIRCVNPAYPEGMMLAILFMNMFAPLVDHFAIRRNIQRRIVRSGA
ncbi:MAG: NADH:ubiquinone reductase (Na(+)-transporting) subunit B [Deltaproteobacteria bacterium]|nr:NADH:ubiquinone reductase (Na(+)-transporting) subunit B [Deltaproteobacteria bacterium]MBW2447880.1 NADH:ubiquinone reductase (Na(+)-transporting) subunit B [Deltaproteobacteria bacterium]